MILSPSIQLRYEVNRLLGRSLVQLEHIINKHPDKLKDLLPYLKAFQIEFKQIIRIIQEYKPKVLIMKRGKGND